LALGIWHLASEGTLGFLAPLRIFFAFFAVKKKKLSTAKNAKKVRKERREKLLKLQDFLLSQSIFQCAIFSPIKVYNLQARFGLRSRISPWPK
jgi:hypothetical protein